jgi:hypothetical protein
MNLDFLINKGTTEPTESPDMKTVPTIDLKLLWAQAKTTSRLANIETSNTINQKVSPRVTEPPTTLTTAEATSDTTIRQRSQGRGHSTSSDKTETPEKVTEQSTKTAQINLNDLLNTGTTRIELDIKTTNKASLADNNKNSENSFGTTKNSLLESGSTINLRTTKLEEKVSSEANSKNDKRTEEGGKSWTVKEIVAENSQRSSAEPLSSQGPSPNNNKASSGSDLIQKQTTGASNLIDLIAASGSPLDNKRGEADEKTKSPLNDLLGASRKEITFSGADKSVTSADTKYQPPQTKS